jgi:hypothetical protein
MRTQAELAQAFRALHERAGAFVIPNPWDVGSARVLAGMGFEALATTSSGFAYSIGKRDNTFSREESMAHLRALVANVDVPINADLGNAFGDDPATVAATFREVAGRGLAGASVEDDSGDRDNPIYEFELAVERVRAAAEVTRALSFPFMLTARAENFLHGRPRPRGHDPAAAGVPGGGCGCALRAGDLDERGDRGGDVVCGSAGERAHRLAGDGVLGERPRRVGREAHQHGRPTRAGGHRCADARRRGDAGKGHVHVHEGRRRLSGRDPVARGLACRRLSFRAKRRIFPGSSHRLVDHNQTPIGRPSRVDLASANRRSR